MIFLSYFKNHRWLFAADVTCAVGIAAIDLLFPLVTRSALYEMLPNQMYRTFFTIMVIVAVCYVLRSFLNYVVGCFIGLAIGVIVGAISKLAEGTKIGIVIGISMVMSILSDLCINGVKYEIQQHVPIINKLNPAALISDSFYALNVYSDHQVFTENIVIMTIEAVVLIAVGILMVRRNRYASV